MAKATDEEANKNVFLFFVIAFFLLLLSYILFIYGEMRVAYFMLF